MRVLDPAFAAHLESGETTLCLCWRLTRRDGAILGFTDHDRPLTFDATAFVPMSGFDAGAASARLGAEVDTSEVAGLLDDDRITPRDLELGRYAGAVIETYLVNWLDPAERHLRSRDTIGEVTEQDGVFRAELRSPHAALNQANGRVYQRSCDADLGDARCGVDLSGPERQRVATVTTVLGGHHLRVTGLEDRPVGWSVQGRAEWLTGERASLVDRIAQQDRDDGGDTIATDADLLGSVAPGDTVRIIEGCDRAFATCRDRFGNAVNFRGFPHIPGGDFILRYPREGSRFNGEPLVP
ncbi:DUF2163 domain-containing protein [Cucumibacter marinus]|uniref:DUF2163 domain-containing protein n=1 Tax=Cucumibacter marinus TaxID=1121252 RepID=UPI00040A5D7C|nr:DUF2163 domain-containing protein [Cucumibacter marinus]